MPAVFIYISSLSIYGDSSGKIFEHTKPKPNTDYSRSKLMAESTVPEGSYILRPGTIYGQNMNRNRFISYAANIIKTDLPLDIHNPQTQYHLVHADDIVDLAKLIISRNPEKKIYNLCNETLSKVEICNHLIDHFKSKSVIKVSSLPYKPAGHTKQFNKSSKVNRTFCNSIGDIF